MRKKLVIAAGILVVLVSYASAQQPGPLTLQDCVRLASAAPSAVSVARLEREIAARGVTQAKAGFLPQSQLLNGFVYNSPLLDDRSVFSFLPLNGIREYATLFTATQELDTSGRLRADLARARAAQQAASTSVALSERDLRRAVTSAFYRLLLTRHVVRIAADALAESRNFEARTKLLLEQGEVAQGDVVKASVEAAFLEQALNGAELDARLASQELASFWTRDVDQPIQVVDVLDQPAPPPEGQTAAGVPYLRRFEFSLLDAQKKSAQADYRSARAGLLPQLGLTFQYGLDSTAVRIRDRGYAAFVNLTIPVFDWMKARSAMDQAQSRVQQNADNRAIAERTFSRDYQGALARVKQLHEQISLAQRQAQLAEEDLRISRVRYEGGEGSALDVVTAQNQLAQARTNYYSALANYLNARADLDVASGK